jgi:hypothetical protein
MNLFFLGRPIQVHGPCDDGWVWATWVDEKGRDKAAWHWMLQCKATPEGK